MFSCAVQYLHSYDLDEEEEKALTAKVLAFYRKHEPKEADGSYVQVHIYGSLRIPRIPL